MIFRRLNCLANFWKLYSDMFYLRTINSGTKLRVQYC